MFFFLILAYTYAFTMKVFSIGKYTLHPTDYGFKQNIVVEIWSAGGSSSGAYQEFGCSGSGAYIKANVKTKWETFKITVGKAVNNSLTCKGEDSSFTNMRINLTVSGGEGQCSTCIKTGRNATCGLGGKITSTSGTEDVIFSSGNGAKVFCNPGSTCSGIFCMGGNAPNGGSGGMYSIFNVDFKPNGTSPGGGGGQGYQGDEYNSPFGFGGDGAVIVYW
jgi:hypothetical protein